MEEVRLNLLREATSGQIAESSGESEGAPGRADLRALRAWVLYDFAYIIWSIDILSIHGQLFLQDVLKASDSLWAWTVTAAMVVVAVVAPLQGAWSDRTGRRMVLLRGWALLCIGVTLFVPWAGHHGGPLVAAGLLGLSIIGFQLSQAVYHGILPDLAPPADRGRWSAAGIGVGFMGTLLGLATVGSFVSGRIGPWTAPWPAGGSEAAFIPAALLYLLFAIPAFIRLPDRPPRPIKEDAGLRNTFAALKDLLSPGRHPGLARFMLANLLFMDAVNTVILFMATYATRAIGLKAGSDVELLLATSTVVAIAGAFVWGRMTDRLGAHRALHVCLASWSVALVLAVVIRDPDMFRWIVGPAIGWCMGGTGTIVRPYLSQLAPPESHGTVFGIWALVGRAAAVLGPLVWGLAITLGAGLGEDRFRLALGSQGLMLLAGWALLAGMPRPAPSLKSS
ncbi:MAG: MFS transporter [Candidatus Sericytochromatia bacterium]|nr:MFS transporter [Candidatus Sericytochromatia bacterium]